MKELFTEMTLGNLTLANRFVFPPIKTAYGTPKGNVTERHLRFYRQIAHNGPAVVILEPVAVIQNGKEHPKQLCVHLEDSVSELKKIVGVIHGEHRLACLHLNHAGAAANPKASGAYTLLRDRTLRKETDGNDRLLSRVQKLLALAQNKIIFKADSHSGFILFPSDFLEPYDLRFHE